MSSDKPAKGDMVEILHPYNQEAGWMPAEVEDPLAVQFTVLDGEGATLFFFYADREKYSGQVGATWRSVS